MRAAVTSRYGSPEVVHIQDVQMPAVRPDALLVRVHASTVNRTDCGFRAAKPFIVRFFAGLSRPRHPVLRCEFAGVVEAVGDSVTRFHVGDRVFGYDDVRFGGHAEYVSVGEGAAVATIPDGVPFEVAAAGTEGSHYAKSAIRWAKVRVGQDVLIHGATGAIGSAAVQLLKALGANVTATSTTAQLEMVRGLGADRVIDHQAEDFTHDSQRYDVVIDAVERAPSAGAADCSSRAAPTCRPYLGPFLQNPLLALVTPILPGRWRFALPSMDQETVQHLRELIATGNFRPVIDRTYPLDEIIDAYRYSSLARRWGTSSSGSDVLWASPAGRTVGERRGYSDRPTICG